MEFNKKTLIELYDDEPVYNILPAASVRPCRLICLGGRKLRGQKIKGKTVTPLRYLEIDVPCEFYTADMSDLASVKKQLEIIIDTYPDCIVDITGGNETALVAVGAVSAERSLSVFRYDRLKGCFRNVCGCEEIEGSVPDSDFSVDAILSMAGGAMKSHGHLSVSELDERTEADVFRIWTVYKKHHRGWHKAVAYLQQVSKDLEGDELSVDAPSVVYGSRSINGADKAIMNELSEAGIIRNYRTDGGRISFDYSSPLMRSCLCDAGICLELYVFAVAKRMGVFGDVRISVVIDWDGDLRAGINTINEIDVMAVRGFIPLFISCKSGTPNVTALNEIKTLSDRFGGEFARPVLVTMSDVRGRDRYLAERAKDMGVTLIDRSDLISEKLPKKLFGISQI